MIGSHMCADSGEQCMVSNKWPEYWYTQIKSYLNGFGFTKIEAGANLYYIVVDGIIACFCFVR